ELRRALLGQLAVVDDPLVGGVEVVLVEDHLRHHHAVPRQPLRQERLGLLRLLEPLVGVVHRLAVELVQDVAHERPRHRPHQPLLHVVRRRADRREHVRGLLRVDLPHHRDVHADVVAVGGLEAKVVRPLAVPRRRVADHLQVLDLGVERVEVADERREEVRRPRRVDLLLHALGLAPDRELAHEHAHLGLARLVGVARRQGAQEPRAPHHGTSNFLSSELTSSGLIPSLALDTPGTFTPPNTSAILSPTMYSLPAPCSASFSSLVPCASASSTRSCPCAAFCRRYRSASASIFFTSASPRASSTSTFALPVATILSTLACSIAALASASRRNTVWSLSLRPSMISW